MVRISGAGVDLEATMRSGQTFAFRDVRGGYLGAAAGHAAWCGQEGDDLLIDCAAGDEAFWRGYFDVERGYGALLRGVEDPWFRRCFAAYPGLKVLRQDVWEAIGAFILSANNHQRRIEGLFQGIAAAYGRRMVFAGEEVFTFPRAEVLAEASEEDLRALGLGYRAPYLCKTARVVAEGFSLALDAMDYEEALAHLTRLSGVGEKVADCVLLFSTRHQNAFPMDVWMERVMRQTYGMQGTKARIKRQGQAYFGAYAGVVQQFLFHEARATAGRGGDEADTDRRG